MQTALLTYVLAVLVPAVLLALVVLAQGVTEHVRGALLGARQQWTGRPGRGRVVEPV